SSRRRHTRSKRDWSSDVCSSDLGVGTIDVLQRLLQVDDVDPVTFGEDEALHLRVPPAGLVPEVDAALKELAHGDNSHGWSFRTTARGRGSGAPLSGARFGYSLPPPGRWPLLVLTATRHRDYPSRTLLRDSHRGSERAMSADSSQDKPADPPTAGPIVPDQCRST